MAFEFISKTGQGLVSCISIMCFSVEFSACGVVQHSPVFISIGLTVSAGLFTPGIVAVSVTALVFV